MMFGLKSSSEVTCGRSLSRARKHAEHGSDQDRDREERGDHDAAQREDRGSCLDPDRSRRRHPGDYDRPSRRNASGARAQRPLAFRRRIAGVLPAIAPLGGRACPATIAPLRRDRAVSRRARLGTGRARRPPPEGARRADCAGGTRLAPAGARRVRRRSPPPRRGAVASLGTSRCRRSVSRQVEGAAGACSCARGWASDPDEGLGVPCSRLSGARRKLRCVGRSAVRRRSRCRPRALAGRARAAPRARGAATSCGRSRPDPRFPRTRVRRTPRGFASHPGRCCRGPRCRPRGRVRRGSRCRRAVSLRHGGTTAHGMVVLLSTASSRTKSPGVGRVLIARASVSPSRRLHHVPRRAEPCGGGDVQRRRVDPIDAARGAAPGRGRPSSP